ncbi:hypothetical protein ACFFKE_11410 [Streptomyces mutabilis]|uniref:hypothetical protein n=1 Tax=Streptomyces mutabilis TaxID=67332 RepID=UPI0035EF6EFB
MTGVDGEFKNLIFASRPNGPKPDIVLRDAVSNRLEIVRNAEYCLTYPRPLDAAGLSWEALVNWWQRTHPTGQKDQRLPPRRCVHDLRSRLSPRRKKSSSTPTRRCTSGRKDIHCPP